MANSTNAGERSYYDELSKQTITKYLDAIIDSSFDGLWICDGEGKVIRVNKASEEINSIKAEQVLNRKMEDLVKEGFCAACVNETVKAALERTGADLARHREEEGPLRGPSDVFH